MEVVLHIGDKRFIIDVNEAMGICELLCASTRLGKEYIDSAHNNALLFQTPDIAAAFVTPITALTRLEVESNEKVKLEKSR